MRKASSSILPDTPSAAVRGKAETAPRGTARRLSAAVLCLICVCTLLPSCGKNESALPAAGEVIPVSGGAVNGETASGAPDTDEAPDNGGASEATGTQEQYPSENGGDGESDTNAYEADTHEADTHEADKHETDTPETDTPDTAAEEVHADGDTFAALDALLMYPPVYGARVAFYYEDIESGVSYSYNADEIMYSASLIKLPFALSLLWENEEHDLGFDGVFTYTGAEYAYGSGEIKFSPAGSTYTYLELMEYMLRVSDNVAFAVLRGKYGMERYFDFARSIGADSLYADDGWTVNARDGGKILKSAYNYIEGDCAFSAQIKDAMCSSVHTVMLSPGLSGKEIARKYGWDYGAYHDMGIVYDAHPYVIVFLSDMDSGYGYVNAYISSVAAAADAAHASLRQDG